MSTSMAPETTGLDDGIAKARTLSIRLAVLSREMTMKRAGLVALLAILLGGALVLGVMLAGNLGAANATGNGFRDGAAFAIVATILASAWIVHSLYRISLSALHVSLSKRRLDDAIKDCCDQDS